MRIDTSAFSARTYQLPSGQARRVTVARGTVLQIASGSVRVCEPLRWLAESVIAPQAILREGQAHAVSEGRWLEVVALSDSMIVQYEPASRWTALWQRATGLLLRPRAAGQG